MGNPKTNVSKFEEFFQNKQECCFMKKSLVVDYNDLEKFDPDLADLLIDKPEIVLEAAELASKSINDKKYHVRFKNVQPIELTEINADFNGQLLSTIVTIKEVDEIKPRIKEAVFECKGCMRLHIVEQKDEGHFIEPSLCSECGGRSFRLLQDESSFVDYQHVHIAEVTPTEQTTYPTLFILEDDIVGSLLPGNQAQITGIFKIHQKQNGDFLKYVYVNYIEVFEKKLDIYEEEESSELDGTGRNSKEYKSWVENVISRDGKCLCCGSEKYLVAHHIFNYKHHPDYRINEENGVTLCKWCHGKYHSHYGKKSNPVTLLEFFIRFGTNNYSSNNVQNINVVETKLQATQKEIFTSEDDSENEVKKEEKEGSTNFKVYLQFILNSIKELEEEYCGQAPYDLLKDEWMVKEWDYEFKDKKEMLDNLIKNLKMNGLIFEPTNGYLKRA